MFARLVALGGLAAVVGYAGAAEVCTTYELYVDGVYAQPFTDASGITCANPQLAAVPGFANCVASVSSLSYYQGGVNGSRLEHVTGVCSATMGAPASPSPGASAGTVVLTLDQPSADEFAQAYLWAFGAVLTCYLVAFGSGQVLNMIRGKP